MNSTDTTMTLDDMIRAAYSSYKVGCLFTEETPMSFEEYAEGWTM